eukprot:14655581-Alexandrium_andersonii.AAC.1
MVEELRQNWRKNKYAELKQNNPDLNYAEAWKLSGKKWAEFTHQAKAYMAARDILSVTRGSIDKL